MSASKTRVCLLFLLILFFLRVLGQIVVAVWAPKFLPPMQAWYSGLMPYPFLLPTQIGILVVFCKIINDLFREDGFWFHRKRRLGVGLFVFGVIYFLAMIVRFYLQGISIPVVFHWVLASFFLTLGWYHKSQSETPP